MSTIHVGFSHPDSTFERIVAFVTGGPFCHCEIAIAQRTTPSDTNVTTWSSYWGEGVCKAKSKDLWHRSRKWSWFALTAHDPTSVTHTVYFLDNTTNLQYNYKGFIMWLLPDAITPQPRENTYFCSQLCAKALSEWHGLHLDKPAHKISPNCLYKLLMQQNKIVPDTPTSHV
jgi:hypothetical protein